MSDRIETGAALEEARARHGFVIGLAGWSGSGKTTLAEKLIAGLSARGLDVATLKHAHHAFDADTPGKDSYRRRKAGARQVIVSSRARSVLFTENADRGKSRLEDLLDALAPADIVMSKATSANRSRRSKIFRTATGSPVLHRRQSDHRGGDRRAFGTLANAPPSLDLNDIEAIVDFVCNLSNAGAVAAAS